VPEKVPEKVPGGFGAEPGQVQQGSGEGSGEGLGGFGESQVGLAGFAAFQFTETKLGCIERCFAVQHTSEIPVQGGVNVHLAVVQSYVQACCGLAPALTVCIAAGAKRSADGTYRLVQVQA